MEMTAPPLEELGALVGVVVAVGDGWITVAVDGPWTCCGSSLIEGWRVVDTERRGNARAWVRRALDRARAARARRDAAGVRLWLDVVRALRPVAASSTAPATERSMV